MRSMVSEDVAPHLLAVLGETLSNAIRHAGATRIDVRVSAGDSLGAGGLRQRRRDPCEVQESGLRNIRDRATCAGWRLCGRVLPGRHHHHVVGAVRLALRLRRDPVAAQVRRVRRERLQPATDDADAGGQHQQAGPASAARWTCASVARPTSTPAQSAVKRVMILTSATTARGRRWHDPGTAGRPRRRGRGAPPPGRARRPGRRPRPAPPGRATGPPNAKGARAVSHSTANNGRTMSSIHPVPRSRRRCVVRGQPPA